MIIKKNEIKVSLCSLPAEGAGEVLSRKRSEGPFPHPPNVAIVNLIKMMERSGYSSQSWDYFDIDMLYPSDEEIRNYFISYKPHVVGLSAILSTSYSQVKRVSSIVRTIIPEAWIVMGGNLSASAEVILNHTEVDLCVCGDGEIAWIEILDHVLKYPDRNDFLNKEKLYVINGVAFLRANGEFKLNGFGKSIPSEDIEFPDYEILKKGLKGLPQDIMNYFRKGSITKMFGLNERAKINTWENKKIAVMFTSKGCVGKCAFCQRTTKGYKKMSLKKLEDHLIYLKNNYNVGFIKLLDECFGADREYGYKVADLLNKHGMLWYALMRTNSINEKDIAYYRSKGASEIRFGIETGSQKMLNIMAKKARINDTLSAVSACLKYGMDPSLSALLGMPGEDEKTVTETGILFGEIAAKRGVHPKILGIDIFFAMPHQGTPLWFYGQKIGVIPSTLKELDGFLMEFSYFSFYKRFYINLNGASIKEVLFWDYLLMLEASRVFWLKVSDIKTKKGLVDDYKVTYQNEKKINPRLSLKYKAIKFTIITRFVDNYLVGNRIIDFLPRWIIYPLIKNILYIEYLIQNLYTNNKKYPLFYTSKNIKRFVPEKEQSLRDSVKKTQKELAEMPQVEINRYLLNFGPY